MKFYQLNIRTNKNYLVFAFILVSFIVMNACGKDVVAEKSFCDKNSFLTLSIETAVKKIKQCSLESQVELYLHWSRRTHPENYELADPVASNGLKIVPQILKRIKTDKSPMGQVNKPFLFELLKVMQENGYYSVNQDKELIEHLGHAISSMPTNLPAYKEIKKDLQFQLEQILNYRAQ